VQSVLHDGHQVELDELTTRLHVLLEVGVVLAQVALEECDVAAPADAAVADVRLAGVLDHRRVVADVRAAREVDVLLARAQVFADLAEEVAPHRGRERPLPVGRRRRAILAGVFVHVERHEVAAVDPLAVDPLGRLDVLRHRADREDHGARGAGLVGLDDPVDDVVGEAVVEVLLAADEADQEAVVMRGFAVADALLADGSHTCALRSVRVSEMTRETGVPHANISPETTPELPKGDVYICLLGVYR